jgi:Cu/Ag efflux pump CusA
VKPALGPDATGVGWIYEYALVDRSGSMTWDSCARCRTGS